MLRNSTQLAQCALPYPIAPPPLEGPPLEGGLEGPPLEEGGLIIRCLSDGEGKGGDRLS